MNRKRIEAIKRNEVTTALKVIPISNKNNLASINMLEELLDKAKGGTLIGITGVFHLLDGDTGLFAIGSICDRPAQVFYELTRLQIKMQGQGGNG